MFFLFQSKIIPNEKSNNNTAADSSAEDDSDDEEEQKETHDEVSAIRILISCYINFKKFKRLLRSNLFRDNFELFILKTKIHFHECRLILNSRCMLYSQTFQYHFSGETTIY